MSLKIMSINQLSELTGKDRRTIKKKLAALPTQPGSSSKAILYNTADALQALYGADSTESVDKELKAEELRIERAKREKLEIEVGRLRGEMLPLSEVVKVVEKEYSFVRAQFRSLPSKLTKPLSLLSDPHEIHSRLTEAVDECLIELTADKTYESQNELVESARESSDSESEHRAGSEPET